VESLCYPLLLLDIMFDLDVWPDVCFVIGYFMSYPNPRVTHLLFICDYIKSKILSQ